MSQATLKLVEPTLSPVYNSYSEGTGYHHRNRNEVKVGFKVRNYTSSTVYTAQPVNVRNPIVAQSFINDVFNVCNMFQLDAMDVKTIQRIALIVASSPRYS